MIKDLSLNIPLLKDLEKMHGYTRFMKELVIKMIEASFEDIGGFYHCSVVTFKSLAQKKSDPKEFIIPGTIGISIFSRV